MLLKSQRINELFEKNDSFYVTSLNNLANLYQ